MALHTDLTYTNLLSCHFEKITKKGDYLWNVRCPFCGDSQQNKRKMRGYIYKSKQQLAFKCHNCNASTWLGALIKHLNPRLYQEYLLETFKDSPPRGHHTPTNKIETATSMRFGTVDQVTYLHAERISDLPTSHYAVAYVKSRQIPKAMWSKLFFTHCYKDFLDEAAPEHGKKVDNDARLVIPFYDAYGAVIALSGRAFDDTGIRYITVRANKDDTKLIYGLDRCDQNKPTYIVEGPIDSMFIENCVAAGTADLIGAAKQLSAAKITLIWDNEPRSLEIVKQMNRAIKAGYTVMIWPEWIKEKDINAMVLAGHSPSTISALLYSHAAQGLAAQAHLIMWKKCDSNKGVLV